MIKGLVIQIENLLIMQLLMKKVINILSLMNSEIYF